MNNVDVIFGSIVNTYSELHNGEEFDVTSRSGQELLKDYLKVICTFIGKEEASKIVETYSHELEERYE